MIISAKFPSVCPCCQVRIVAGTKVEWFPGSPARHTTCSGKSATGTTRSTPVRRRAPMGSGHGTAAPVAGYAKYCTDNSSCGCYDCAS